LNSSDGLQPVFLEKWIAWVLLQSHAMLPSVNLSDDEDYVTDDLEKNLL